jgi:hypothetical protein
VLAWLQEIFDLAVPTSSFETIETLSPGSSEPGMGTFKNWMREAYAILPPRGKITWLRGMFFPSADYIRWVYHPKPDWLWPLYLPRRWWEML